MGYIPVHRKDLWEWDGVYWTWIGGTDVPYSPGNYSVYSIQCRYHWLLNQFKYWYNYNCSLKTGLLL